MIGPAGIFDPYFLAFIVLVVFVSIAAVVFVLGLIILFQVRRLLEIKIQKDQIQLAKLREDNRV